MYKGLCYQTFANDVYYKKLSPLVYQTDHPGLDKKYKNSGCPLGYETFKSLRNKIKNP